MQGNRVAVLWAACALVAGAPAAAQVSGGGQVSLTGDGEPGIGPRVGLTLDGQHRGPGVVASFDWFFTDRGSRAGSGSGVDVTYYELNGNVLYAFRERRTGGATPYAGAGLNVAYRSYEYEGGGAGASTSATDLGLNLIGGMGFRSGGAAPFVELRLELGGGEQLVISAGVLLGRWAGW